MKQPSRPIVLSIEAAGRHAAAPPGRGGDGYPPFDVERFAGADGGVTLRITLAVAGFTAEELEVLASHNQLVIRGRQAEEPNRAYLYRGIAARRFQKSFVLAEDLELVTANLRNGLLSIDLTQPPKDRAARAIAINAAG